MTQTSALPVNVLRQSMKAAERLRFPSSQPLSPVGTLAALLVVEELLDIVDAANAARVTPNDLILEAQAWAYAAEVNANDDT
jgi:hypothetical protein